MANSILIVEDDENISKLVSYNLEKAGFRTREVGSGEDALALVKKESFDLMILDIMLPGINGLEVCKNVKGNKRTSSIKVLMLTAKGEEVDKILGFELGADDYVVKPFSPRELVLRVKAILKRNESIEDVITSEDLRVDVNNHDVFIGSKKIALTAMELKLLVMLMGNKGNVMTRELLLEKVWDMSSEVTTRTIDTHIKRLRQKLGRHGQKIETVRSVGYRFKEV